MSSAEIRAFLVRLDTWSWALFLIWFVVGTVISTFQKNLMNQIGAVGIWLVLLLTIVRLVLVAEQFRETGQGRYRLLSYLLLLVLFFSIGAQFMVR